MFAKPLLILFTLTLWLPFPAMAQARDAASTVREFYAFDQNASQVFNRRNLNTRRRWMTPRLYKLFLAELEKQRKFLSENPNENPYFGDGFPFRPIDEACEVNRRSYRRRHSVQVGAPSGRLRAEVLVRFSYPKPCTIKAITYKVQTVRSGSQWLIDDIVFDDGGRLSESMKNHLLDPIAAISSINYH